MEVIVEVKMEVNSLRSWTLALFARNCIVQLEELNSLHEVLNFPFNFIL